MMKRLGYILYVAFCSTFLVLLAVAAARHPELGDPLYVAGSFSGAAVIRWCGYRWLDIDGRKKTLELGTPPDEASENPGDVFGDSDSDLIRRQEIHRRLIEIENRVGHICDAYREDLERVLDAKS